MIPEASQEVLNNLSRLFDQENIKVALKQTGKAGLIAGICTTAGGLLAGQIGFAVGGLAGTALNAYFTPNFVPLSKIIQNDLNDEQKNNLVQMVKGLIKMAPSGAAISGFISNDNVKKAVIQAVLGFVQNARSPMT